MARTSWSGKYYIENDNQPVSYDLVYVLWRGYLNCVGVINYQVYENNAPAIIFSVAKKKKRKKKLQISELFAHVKYSMYPSLFAQSTIYTHTVNTKVQTLRTGHTGPVLPKYIQATLVQVFNK